MSNELTSPPIKKQKTEEVDENNFLSPPQSHCRINDNVDNSLTKDECCSSTSGAGDVRSLLLKEAGYDINNPTNTLKRKNYLAWDDYFMAITLLSAKRSKDPEERFGACIVDEDNRIVGIGYNGFCRGCSDDCLPWASSDEQGRTLHTKHPFICHAEVNAILNKISNDVKGCKMYVAKVPDNESAKIIIQAGITEVVYMNDAKETNSTKASKIMFEMAGVKLRKYEINSIAPLDFSKVDGDCQCSDGCKKGEDSIQKYRDLLIREADFDPTKSVVKKRDSYLSWDDYFTAVAYLTARRSKDPNTQVGCCIVDENKCIVGVGYNGFPRGCDDDHLPWARTGDSELHKKYPYVVHAEVNAILNKGSGNVKNASLYVALFPCCECAKVIIQAGIKEVIYLNDVYHNTDSCKASRIMFEMAGVKTRCHIPSVSSISVN